MHNGKYQCHMAASCRYHLLATQQEHTKSLTLHNCFFFLSFSRKRSAEWIIAEKWQDKKGRKPRQKKPVFLQKACFWEWSRSGKVTWHAGCCRKMRFLSRLFGENNGYFLWRQVLQQQSIWQMFFRPYKTLLKKTHPSLHIHGLERKQCCWWFRSDVVVFDLFKVFSSWLQHVVNYKVKVCDQMIETTTNASVVVALTV